MRVRYLQKHTSAVSNFKLEKANATCQEVLEQNVCTCILLSCMELRNLLAFNTHTYISET